MRRLYLVLALALGCGGSDSKGSATDAGATGGVGGSATGGVGGSATGGVGGGGGSGGASGSGGAGGAMTDMQWCQQACTKLAGCGVAYDATCPGNCLQAPVFLACVKSSSQECSALALCPFRQAGAAFCGGEAAGTPSGGGTCKGAADCEGACTGTGQPLSCQCKCWAGLAPAKALNLLINNECATARCKVECAPGSPGATCLQCHAAKCQSEAAQCQGS